MSLAVYTNTWGARAHARGTRMGASRRGLRVPHDVLPGSPC
jgi:hypothetical protein